MNKLDIVCIGEILWDSMPLGLFLGGAPFNVAYHLNKLGANVKFVSCVGNDDLGQEAIKRTAKYGICTDLIQMTYKYKTGFVDVNLGAEGIPVYNIKKPAAWDFINLTKELHAEIQKADVIVFGTLAQRMETSRKTISVIKKSTALKVVDLNLRSPFDDKEIVKLSLEMSDFLKVNFDELQQLKNWFNLSSKDEQAVSELTKRFRIQSISITKGANGAAFFNDSEWVESKGVNINAIDTVGAGDAFLAALVSDYLKGVSPEENLKNANKLAAYVATCFGGTPDYTVSKLTDINALSIQKKNV